MAEGFSYDEATAGSDNSSDGFSFEDALGSAAAAPESTKALKETDALGVRGGPAQGPLGKLFGLRDPFIGPDGNLKPELESKATAYNAAERDKGFSPMVGDIAESGARMATMGAAIGVQALPRDHPVRQQIEGTYSAIHGMARELSEEDNLALLAATAGLGGPAASAASKLGSRAVSAAFAAQIASALPDQWRQFKEAPDLKTKTAMAAQLIGTLGFTGITGKHALLGDRPMFGRVSPPLEPDVTIPTDPAAQIEMLSQGLQRGDISQAEYEDLLQKIQPQQAAPGAPQPPAPGVVSETARVEPQPGAGAATETPAGETPVESPEEAQARYSELRDRFGIYGIDHAPIVDAAEAKGDQLTHAEAADALATHEKTLPSWMRRRSIASGKTFPEINAEIEWTDFIRQKLAEQERQIEKDQGVLISSSQPAIAVSKLPEGGWKVTVGARQQDIQVPPEKQKGSPTFHQRTVPQTELYLSPKGELKPYADKPYTPPNALPDVKGKPTVRSPAGETQKGGPRQAPPEGPRTQPVAASQRPVAPEAPPEAQYVVEDLFDPRTKKTIGAIVKDQATGKTVKRFQSPERNPDANDLIAMREKAKEHIKKIVEKTTEAAAKSQKEEPTLVTGAKKRQFKVGFVFDEYGNSPETPVATALTEMGGIKSKSAAIDQGKYKGNEALWDDPVKLSHPTHRKIYDPNGEMPDVMAQSLYDAGLIHEPSVDAMRVELEKESAGIRSRAGGSPEEAGMSGKIKQAENFGKGQRQEQDSSGKAIPVESLSVGDKVKVDGTELKVTDVDPEGTVTLEDGKRFGIQQVSDGDVVYGEMGPSKPAKPDLNLEEPESDAQMEARLKQEGKTNEQIQAAKQKAKDIKVETKLGFKARKLAGDTGDLGQADMLGGGDLFSGKKASPEIDSRSIGLAGRKALNTAPSNPIAARRAAFEREGDHHVHKDTGLIIRHNKDKGMFEVVHPETGEVLDTGPTRRATIDKHLDGLFRKAAPDPPPFTAEGEPEYDFSNMQGFEEFLSDRFGREMTDKERQALEPIIQKVADAKTDASEAGSAAYGKILQYFHDVKDIPFDDAVKQIKDAIKTATSPCK